MCDKIEKFSKLKEEFNFQKHWIKIFLRGKFLLQELPEKSILLIVTRLNAISFVRLMQTCKWLHILIRENKPEILIFSSYTVYLPIEEITDDGEESVAEPQIDLLTGHKFILKPASLISLRDEKLLFKLIRADLYELLKLEAYFSAKKNYYSSRNDSSLFNDATSRRDVNLQLSRTLKSMKNSGSVRGSRMTLRKGCATISACATNKACDINIGNTDYIVGVASDLDYFLRKCTNFLLFNTSTISGCHDVIKSFILAIELAIREFHPFEEIYFIFGNNPIEDRSANNKLFDYSIILYPSMIEICGKISQTPTNLLIHFLNLPPITYSLCCLKTEEQQEMAQNGNTDDDDELQISIINKTLIEEIKENGGDFTHLFQQSYNDFQLDKELFDPNFRSKLPPLQREMPSDDVALEIFQNVIEVRRKWMKQLQKGKFILGILPLNCVLEIVKRMETVEFVRMQKTSKWISELIENKRSTFIKSFSPSDSEAGGLICLNIVENSQCAWYEVSNNFTSWNNFLFPCITFVYGLNDMTRTRDALHHLRGSNILNYVLNMGNSSTLIPEALEAFRSRELVIYKYQLDSIHVPSFPSTLEKIRIEFDDNSLDAEYFDFVDCVSTFKGKLRLFGDFENNSSLSDKLQALLRMKRRNLESKHISGVFFIKPFGFYAFEEVFPPTEDNFTFKKVLKIFKKETEGDSPFQEIIIHWEFGICLQRVGPGAVAILTFMKRPATSCHLQRKLRYYIDFIATFEDFRDLIHAKLFEKFIKSLWKHKKEILFVEQDNDLVSVLEATIVEESVYIEIQNKLFAPF